MSHYPDFSNLQPLQPKDATAMLTTLAQTHHNDPQLFKLRRMLQLKHIVSKAEFDMVQLVSECQGDFV